MSRLAWQEQPVHTLDVTKAAQPLRASQVKRLQALHLNPAAALHTKQLQLSARGSKWWAHQCVEERQKRLAVDYRRAPGGCCSKAA